MKTEVLNHQTILKAPRKRRKFFLHFQKRWGKFLSLISLFVFVFILGFVLVNHPYFVIQETQVVGELSELSVDQILKSAELTKGANLFKVSLKRIEQNILTLPWVSHVSVRRQIPSTLWIHVKEKKAKALLLDKDLYFISEQGDVFKKVEMEKVRDLPVLTGLKREENLEGALKLLSLFEEETFFETLGVSEVYYHPTVGFSVMTLSNPMHFYFGKENFREKLSRLQKIWPEVEKQVGRVRGIDFEDVNKIFIKL